MDYAVCTIVSKNHLPFARVFAESYKKHNKGEVFLLLVDRVDGCFDPAKEPFKMYTIEDFRDRIPEFESFCFRYSILELNCAMKPYFIESLFNEHGFKKLLYFDSDILVTGSVDELIGLLDSHPLIITPHFTAPLKDGFLPNEVGVLMAGQYNAGFFGITNTPAARGFIEWWKDRLYTDCIQAVEKGLCSDQKWLDFATSYLDDVLILKDPGCNIAYWNLFRRELTEEDGRYYVNGRPAVFFHLSGFDPDNAEVISRHQNRVTLEKHPQYRGIFEEYGKLVKSKGWAEAHGWPYAFGRFDNGADIPPFARRLFHEMRDDARRFGNPFETAQEGSFYNWLNEPMNQARPDVTRWSLATQVRQTAPGVQELMDLLYQKEEVISQKEAEIRLILNSLSWKITAPLRKTLGLLKR